MYRSQQAPDCLHHIRRGLRRTYLRSITTRLKLRSSACLYARHSACRKKAVVPPSRLRVRATFQEISGFLSPLSSIDLNLLGIFSNYPSSSEARVSQVLETRCIVGMWSDKTPPKVFGPLFTTSFQEINERPPRTLGPNQAPMLSSRVCFWWSVV